MDSRLTSEGRLQGLLGPTSQSCLYAKGTFCPVSRGVGFGEAEGKGVGKASRVPRCLWILCGLGGDVTAISFPFIAR